MGDKDPFYDMFPQKQGFPQYPVRTYPEVLYPTKLKTQYDQVQRSQQLANKQIEGHHTTGSRILSGFGNLLNAYNARKRQKEFDKTLAEYQRDLMMQPPEPAKMPGSYKEFQYASQNPEYAKFLDRKARSSGTNVNISMGPGSPEYDARSEGLYEDFYKPVLEAGRAAEAEISNLNMAEQMALRNQEGELPPQYQAALANIAIASGVPPEMVGEYVGRMTDAQQFTALMNNLVLKKLQAQKGPQTERDAKRIEQTVASLGNTPQARMFLIKTSKAFAQRDIDKAKFYDSYWRQNGTYDGAEEAWREGWGGAPITMQRANGQVVLYEDWARLVRQKTVEAGHPEPSEAELKAEWMRKYGYR